VGTAGNLGIKLENDETEKRKVKRYYGRYKSKIKKKEVKT
jgi:hypothetical protein